MPFSTSGASAIKRHSWFFLPAAADKTVVAADVIQHQVNQGKRVLFMAHREELLTQAADKIKKVTGLDSAVEKAESTSLGSLFPVTVGSVQTLCRERRLSRFAPDHFQTIIVDEAHHIMSDSYMTVMTAKKIISIVRSYKEMAEVPIYYMVYKEEEDVFATKDLPGIEGIITRPIARGDLQKILDKEKLRDYVSA